MIPFREQTGRYNLSARTFYPSVPHRRAARPKDEKALPIVEQELDYTVKEELTRVNNHWELHYANVESFQTK